MALLTVALLGAPGVLLEVSACPEALEPSVRDELTVAGLESDDLLTEVSVRCAGAEVDVALRDVASGREHRGALRLGPDARGLTRVAVQVVDLVRASLAEARFSGLLAPVVHAAPAPPPAPPRPPSALRGWLGGGATLAPGGLGLQPSLAGEVSYALGSLELGLGAWATVRAARLVGTVGRAEFGVGGSQVVGAVTLEHGAWTLTPHMEVGVLVAWGLGEATALAWEGRLATAATLALGLGVSAWRAVGTGVSVGVVVDARLTPVPVRVELPGAAARVGLPVLAAGLALRFR